MPQTLHITIGKAIKIISGPDLRSIYLYPNECHPSSYIHSFTYSYFIQYTHTVSVCVPDAPSAYYKIHVCEDKRESYRPSSPPAIDVSFFLFALVLSVACCCAVSMCSAKSKTYTARCAILLNTDVQTSAVTPIKRFHALSTVHKISSSGKTRVVSSAII